MEEGYIAEEPYTDEDEANTFFASGEIQAGDTSEVTFLAPDTPGTYQIICNVPAHLSAGMVGTLVITE